MLSSRFIRPAVISAAIVFVGYLSSRAVAPAAAQSPTPDARAHGEYLVTGAGQCADCHGANLGGAPLHIPGPPGVPWAKTVPSLRGLPMFKTDADAIAFFTTATLPNGTQALHPMPRYTFDRTDATAIVAYLRGLN